MTNQERPIVLIIAASDSAGMAGVQMDVKVHSTFDVHPMTAITANTAQNNQSVISTNCVKIETLKMQLEAINHFSISAIKIGLLADTEQVDVIADFVRYKKVPVIFDPVISASSQVKFSQTDVLPSIIRSLLPHCTLVTPNLDEAALLTGAPVSNIEQMQIAAQSIIELGANKVLIKGGHLSSAIAQDYFLSKEKSFWLSSPKQASSNTRGTGCAMASAVSASMALGFSIEDAVVIAKMVINQGLRKGYSVNGEKGPISINYFPDEQCDLPFLSDSAEVEVRPQPFRKCDQTKLGLYPIVDRADWIARLAPCGVSTIQLRIKDLKSEELAFEIKSAIEIAQQYNCRLFINDYWQLAIEYGAYGVHLGQEDIETADLKAIKSAGLRLGLSSHCHYEVARAIAINPSYIACGPVYPTQTKNMPWVPHGLKGLTYWQSTLNFPLVAIGGINQDRFERVLATGVSGIAMISAITQSESPEFTTEKFAELFNRFRH